VAGALDSLGYAHHQLGNHAEATACYQQAIDLHREIGSRLSLAEALGHLGDACHAAGSPAEARAAWEEALTVLAGLNHPDADQIRAKLKELGADFPRLRAGLRGAEVSRSGVRHPPSGTRRAGEASAAGPRAGSRGARAVAT
jgi:tetratricopeptide (TPR) repeat protein